MAMCMTSIWKIIIEVEEMTMKNPPHPGGVVKDCIEDLELSVTEAAGILGVTRPTLSRVINGAVGDIAGNGDSIVKGIW